jgi:hypothetical protein
MCEPKILIEEAMLKDLDTFRQTLLPLINNNRRQMDEQEIITEDDVINCFLDMRKEYLNSSYTAVI